MLFLELFQQCLQLYVSVTWAIERSASVHETKDDVIGGAAMDMRQQLLDAEAKHDGQMRRVLRQQYAYAVKFFKIADVCKDLNEILRVNIRSSC